MPCRRCAALHEMQQPGRPENCRVCLYRQVEALRTLWGVWEPFDPFLIAETLPGMELRCHPFQTKGFHGFIVTSDDKRRARIVLNSLRSPEEQAFDLSHELIHYALHPPTREVHSRAPFLEWQADEGAAELLLPRVRLLDFLYEARARIREPSQADALIRLLARRQGVTAAMVRRRIWSLRLDAVQVLGGADPASLPLLLQRTYPPCETEPAEWFYPAGHTRFSVVK